METTLAKGLKMLEAVADSDGPRGVSELARELGITRSNAHRLLQTLSALGYVRHDPEHGRYEATLRLFELGSGIATRLDVRTIARPIMQSLARQVDENVILSIRDGSEVLVLDRVESTRTLRTHTSLGARSPMHSTSPGKLLLAYAPDDVVDAVARALTAFTPRTIATRSELDAELARIRAQGYATVRAEWHEDTAGMAAPIIRGGASVVAALSVSGPVGRFKPAQMKAYLPHLRAATREISGRLGHQPPASQKGSRYRVSASTL
jgi:DNA-binding IclR family transcriptional regulator